MICKRFKFGMFNSDQLVRSLFKRSISERKGFDNHWRVRMFIVIFSALISTQKNWPQQFKRFQIPHSVRTRFRVRFLGLGLLLFGNILNISGGQQWQVNLVAYSLMVPFVDR
jgi:hypothetical protein